MRILILALAVVFVLDAFPGFAGASRLAAQEQPAAGRVTGPAGQPLAGVEVLEVGTANLTVTGSDGRFRLPLRSSPATLRFRAIGYAEKELPARSGDVAQVELATATIAMEGITVVGTRRRDRSAVETPAPVDVIDMSTLAERSGRLQVNQILEYAAPSFNATRQSGADGSDHVDPATLRGLGPDQTLVLLNGKRRHQSSLINIFGSRGRGNTGTDLNAIPASAIERLEVLRDGASAQYGSDAIAGVVNVVLRSRVDDHEVSVTAGGFDATPPASSGALENGTLDGKQVGADANWGARWGRDGFFHLTGELLAREHTNRPADPDRYAIYRRQFGDAAATSGDLFLNARRPFGDNAAFYAFGGANVRHTNAYAWSRDPGSERNVEAIYPNGFDPVIQSRIDDVSLSTGFISDLGGWTVDWNNTLGYNRFHYSVDGTLNASLGTASPRHFDAGGFSLAENTTEVQASRFYPGALAGINAAAGAELRVERYSIFAGEEGSWRNYGPTFKNVDGESTLVPGGAQGFPGFQPANELAESRTNLGGYADAEIDVTSRLMVGAAGRFERYSDFGSTLNGKLSARMKLGGGVALRGSLSTGFRAPSLAQIYFNSTFTDFVAGVSVDKVIARNDSPLAKALGIPQLHEETANNASLGVTAHVGSFTATVDGYLVDVDNRIVLTGAFTDDDPEIGASLRAMRVGAAQFFTNALDTKTKGVDVVLGYATGVAGGRLETSLAVNANDMELGAVKTSQKLAGKEDIYFGAREEHFLIASAPPFKAVAGLDYGKGALDTELRVTRFGKVVLIDWLDTEDVYEAKTTTDLSLSYRFSDRLRLSGGGVNLFNVYPSAQDTETETGGLWDAVQMGSSGAFFYVGATIGLR